ncbi:MAG: glycosyltransferase involved in cell wall biosynthesis [Psychroserpens sp.]|jgi:glycosyltransferase involved in cell wall biosynthesis
MGKTRIAFFIDVLLEHMDGVANTSNRIISRLDSMEIEPIFFTCLPPQAVDFPYRIVLVPNIKIPYSKDYPFAIPGKRSEIFKILDEFQPDLIHWSSPTLLGKYATRYSKLKGIPNITIYHTHFSGYLDYYNWLPFRSFFRKKLDHRMTNLYDKASLVLAPTLSMKEFLVGEGLSPDKIGIWGRGVDSQKYNPDHRSEELISTWGAQEKIKILFVSRLFHYKETDMLIRLSHILPQNVLLIITGEGPEREKMEKESNKKNTLFTGKLVGHELSEVYASADIFVFPSLTDTFGNVVLEAMASGLPVIAANAGGPKNIVKHGETGYLIEPKNEQAFNDHIRKLSEDKALFNNMKSKALQYARDTNWDSLIKQIQSKYLNLIKKQ